jgi:hypothetical protein
LRGARTLKQFIEFLRLPMNRAGGKSCEIQHKKRSAPNK